MSICDKYFVKLQFNIIWFDIFRIFFLLFSRTPLNKGLQLTSIFRIIGDFM